MRFGKLNATSLNRSGSVTSVTTELERYKLDLVDMQEARWDTVRAGDYNIFYGKEKKSIKWEQNNASN
jgi:hypothetical protein